MKIDSSEYLTIAEARDAIGASQRGIWRAIERAGREKVTIRFLGRTLVPKAAIETLKAHFYPYYSDAHQAMVKEWGRKGGTMKKVNEEARARKRGKKA